ncbi:hypothetical protein [Xanthobacter versatilis]|uniref:hypothetical protein n=1 Tax=Xanthobacter autotrophicus (strain ATCC BAA-1158 / Py2) TaxID=78245 RepID=UPI003729A780
MILVSGYSITLRARIVDRWQELEAQLAQSPTPQFAIPQTLPESIIAAVSGYNAAGDDAGQVFGWSKRRDASMLCGCWRD